MADPITPNTIDENPLPESAAWDTLIGAPTSLSDISISDANDLDQAAQDAADAEAGLGDLAIQGWAFDGIFSASGQTTVNWTSGTLRFKDGTTFAISSGSASSLSTSVPTYLYFDRAASTTVLQGTTTAANAVGENKVLMGALQGNAASGKLAIFQVFGGAGGQSPYISGQNIVAGTILAANIAAGTITANEIATNTITANRLSVSQLSAIAADLGSITAGTITGALIRTASSGARAQMTGTSSTFDIYDSSNNLRSQSYSQGLSFFTTGGQATNLFAGGSTTGFWIDASGSGSGNVIFSMGSSSGTVALAVGTSLKVLFDLTNARIVPASGNNGVISLGASGANWDDLYMNGDHVRNGINQPKIYHGYVSGTSCFDNNSATSVSNGSTGIYTVTHNLGTTAYQVQITPFAALVKSVTVDQLNSNSFRVRISNTSAVLENNDFMFLITKLS